MQNDTALDAGQGTLANWDATTLTKFIQDILTRNPPGFVAALSVDEIVVNDKATFNDKVAFKGQAFSMIGNTGQPAFQNGWQNWGSPNVAGSYIKSPDGWVRLHGLVKNTANPLALPSTIFTLPPGFRPEGTIVYPTIGLNLIARIDIDSAGNVQAVAPTSTAAPWVTLDGLTFKAV